MGLVHQLMHERCRGLPQSVHISLPGDAVQRQVARAILCGAGYDYAEHALEPPPATGLSVAVLTPSLASDLRVGGSK